MDTERAKYGATSRAAAVRTGLKRSLAAWIGCLAAILSACGGGGGDGSSTGGGGNGNGQASLQVSPTVVRVSASIADPAPSALVQVSVLASAAAKFYVAGTTTRNGIDTVNSAANGTVDNVTIQFKSPQSLGAGTYSDTLTLKGCYDQGCTQQVTNSPQTVAVTYTVTVPKPQLSSLSPASLPAGAPAFTLTVSGSNFLAQSVVLWGGSPRPTSYVSANTLTAQISAADIAVGGSVAVTVANRSDGSANSGPIAFTVQPLAPLALKLLSPTKVYAGGTAFTLTVFGSGFTASSAVAWNGSNLPTTYVSDTTLRASVTAAQIASTGTVPISVVNPPNQGGASAALNLTIDAPSIDAVSYQVNPAHTGAVSFKSVSFPASSSWSANVGGTASYALIVGGRVFVTVGVNGNAQLLALDASTGATLWGPIALSGTANAAYDAGTLFVISGTGVTSQIISAIDPVNGNPKWSAQVSGGWFPAPPVAADGVVYALNAGLVSAFDETSGATLWQQSVTGTFGTVALSVDGVYTSAPCTTYALQPLVGTVLWTNNTGCEGGGGNTPVVANGVVYSPIDGQYSGAVYDAESGTLQGNFAASFPPAFTATTGFFLTNSTMQGIARSNNQILWSFAGDGALVTSPIAVNNYVIVGSANGNLYALDGATGSQVWTKNLGAPIPTTSSGTISIYSGLSAGDGLLVVPSGNNVTAYVLSTNP